MAQRAMPSISMTLSRTPSATICIPPPAFCRLFWPYRGARSPGQGTPYGLCGRDRDNISHRRCNRPTARSRELAPNACSGHDRSGCGRSKGASSGCRGSGVGHRHLRLSSRRADEEFRDDDQDDACRQRRPKRRDRRQLSPLGSQPTRSLPKAIIIFARHSAMDG